MRVLVLSHRDVLAALPPQACAEEMAAEAAATVAAVATAMEQGIGTEVEL